MSVLPPSKLTDAHLDAEAFTRPANELERWLASEIAHASWELDRVRANQSNTAAESRLNAAYSRASRNWTRARRELQQLQTARINHLTRLSPTRRKTAAATPLADPARAPQPKLAGPMIEHALDLIQEGIVNSRALRIVPEQEAR